MSDTKRILAAIRTNNPAASGLVRQQLQDKLAVRLAEEREVVAKSIIEGNSMSVQCMECGKKFKTASMDPSCPKCGGSDIDLAESADDKVKTTKSGLNLYRTYDRDGKEIWVSVPEKDINEAKQDNTATITPSNNKDGGFDVKVFNKDDDKPSTFWYKTRQSAVEYIKSGGYTLTETTSIHESKMPSTEVQRVYDETGDIGETELLCGISKLTINANGEVISYISEAWGVTKKAIIREPGHPIGQSAPMYLMCVCGEKVYVPLLYTDQETFECYKCKQKYNRKGYLVEAHWTQVEKWKNKKTGEVVTAGELIQRYDAWLRQHKISLIGSMYDIAMGDGTTWTRILNEATFGESMDARLRHKLSHAVTEYDRRQQNRAGYNMYALSHYLGAVQEIEKKVNAGAPLRQAIVTHLSGQLLDVVLKAVGEAPSTRDEQR